MNFTKPALHSSGFPAWGEIAALELNPKISFEMQDVDVAVVEEADDDDQEGFFGTIIEENVLAVFVVNVEVVAASIFAFLPWSGTFFENAIFAGFNYYLFIYFFN